MFEELHTATNRHIFITSWGLLPTSIDTIYSSNTWLHLLQTIGWNYYPFPNVKGKVFMMISWNGNIFRVTGPLWWESTGHRWIPPATHTHSPATRSFDVFFLRLNNADQRYHSPASLAFVWGIHWGPVNSPHKWPVTRKMSPFDDVIMDLRRHRVHYGVTVMLDWIDNLIPQFTCGIEVPYGVINFVNIGSGNSLSSVQRQDLT